MGFGGREVTVGVVGAVEAVVEVEAERRRINCREAGLTVVRAHGSALEAEENLRLGEGGKRWVELWAETAMQHGRSGEGVAFRVESAPRR